MGRRKQSMIVDYIVFVVIGVLLVTGGIWWWIDSNPAYANQPIIVGQGLGQVQLKATTYAEVQRIVGKRFIEINGGAGEISSRNSVQKFTDLGLEYKEIGLTFGFRSFVSDGIAKESLKLRSIAIGCVKRGSGCVFSGKTNKGIGLGSTLKEVREAYGDSYNPYISWRIVKPEGIIFSAFEVPDRKGYGSQDTDKIDGIVIFDPADLEEFR